MIHDVVMNEREVVHDFCGDCCVQRICRRAADRFRRQENENRSYTLSTG
jgi:hypothetical protein